MAAKTLHVYPVEGGRWAVQKAGTRSTTFSTQGQAMKAARKMASSQREAQVVVHERSGQFTIKDVHGLPVVQKPPQKSAIGTKRLNQAIANVVRKQLETT